MESPSTEFLLMHALAKSTEGYDEKYCYGFNHHKNIFWYIGIDGQSAVFEQTEKKS